MKKIVGLINGRHEMPVSDYIFNSSIENVFDFDAIDTHIYEWINTNVGIRKTDGIGLNSVGYTDDEVLQGNKDLVVYITGLTCITAALIRCCAYNGVSLTLMHYNSATGEYVPQVIFR